uniref:Uncharacterized protein n=1 Tax=Knipowitschia caucasica TaxID=637954 RepID=A0AAV2JDW1_KNICA
MGGAERERGDSKAQGVFRLLQTELQLHHHHTHPKLPGHSYHRHPPLPPTPSAAALDTHGTARPSACGSRPRGTSRTKPAEGPAEQPAERARRGGEQEICEPQQVQGRRGGADQCRDQTTSSQTEDARVAPSSVSRRKRFLQTILCEASRSAGFEKCRLREGREWEFLRF